jgi:hypothetical protein
MATRVVPRLSSGAGEAALVTPVHLARRFPGVPVPTLRSMELDALRNLTFASLLAGVGAGLVDYFETVPGHGFVYYYGWTFLTLAFGLVVWTFARNVLEPLWGHLALFAVGVYGWWNATWTGLMLLAHRDIDGADGSVILANFGSAWPWNGGLVLVSLPLFEVTTLLALLLPGSLYVLARRRGA